MPVKININPNEVSAKVQGAWDKGLFALSSQILADCNEYCKEDTHALIDSSEEFSRLKEGKLIWDTAYAKRQYWAIQTSLTPGRTWKWCETAKRKYKRVWNRIAEKGLKENL